MKTLKLLVFGFSYLLCAIQVCQLASAADPDITQWALPKDAIARFGKGSITDVAYSPHGRYLAVRGSFATWLYDAQTGQVRNMFPNRSAYFHTGDLAFSSDGNTLAVGMMWGIDLWDVTTGNYMKTLNAHDSGATLSLAFLPVSFELASGHSDGTVKVWDTNTNQIYRTFTVNKDPTTEFLLDVSYVFQGQYLAVTQGDGTVHLWHTKPQKVKTTKADGTVVLSSTDPYQLVGTYPVTPATFRPEPIAPTAPNISVEDPNWQVSQRAYDTLLARYHTLSGRYHDLQQDSFSGLWVLPEDPIGVCIKYKTNTLVFFDPNTLERISEVPSLNFSDELIGEVSSFSFSHRIYGDSPDDGVDGPIGGTAMRYLRDEEMLLVWSSKGSTVFAINLVTGEWARLAELASSRFSGHFGWGDQAEAPPDGRLIVYPSGAWGDSPSEWHVIDRGTGVSGDSPHGGTTLSILEGSAAIENSGNTFFEFSPDPSDLITEHATAFAISPIGWNSIVGYYMDYWQRCDGWLWDRPTGKKIASLKAHTVHVSGVTFSPDGTLVAVASGGRIFLWDVATRENSKILEHTFWVDQGQNVRIMGVFDRISISFAPDGQTIASAGGTPDHVFLWDVATGKKIAAYKSSDNVISISYSPDGNHFVTGTSDGNVILWEADTGKNIRTIKAHTGPVESISWSKDGNFFVTAGGYDRTARRWNKDGEPAPRPNILELEEAFATVESVSYSPCGTEVAIGTSATIFIWELGRTDVNRDGTTDMEDVEVVSEHFGKNTLDGDVTGDGVVDIVDLVVTMKQSNEDEKQESQKTFKVLPAEEWWDHNYRIAYSPDGQTLASIGLTGQPIVWDVATGIRLKSLGDGRAGHGESIGANSIISYSPDGATLATGSADGTVHLWDVSQKLLQKGPNEFWDVSHYPDVPTVQYYPDAKSSEPIGTEFTVTLGIADGLLTSITGYEVDLQFDSKVLRYVESTHGDYLPEDTFVVPTIVNENQLKLAAASGSGVNRERGILASVTFEVISQQPASLKLSNVRLAQGVCLIYPDVKVQKIELQSPDNAEPERLAEDVNGDGTVNIQDLVLVAANLGQSGNNPADVNGDGTVNIQDLVQVAGQLGTADAASPAWADNLTDAFTRAEVELWLRQAQQLNLTDAISQRGIGFLESLLVLLTPQETALLANYPNPFNPETWIPYQLADPAEVTLRIYAVDGSLVRMLSLGHKAVGIYQSRSRAAYWDGRNELGEPVASGVYFYTFTAGDFTATRKMLIRK